MSFISKQKNVFRKALVSVGVAAAFVNTNVYANAQENVAEVKAIEKIVVVGATTNTKITPEQLEKYQANDLADIFRQTPSVTVGGSLGVAQKVYVRGLEDSMVNVTVDGAPQTSTLFHHIGRVSIEPELLQSVEVQAGAGEATAGTGAVGGAIRFKTKSADNLLSESEQFGGIVKASYFSNSGHKESISLYGKATEKVGILASFVNVSRDNMEDGDGEEIPGTAADQTLAFVKVNTDLTENQKLTVSYESRKEEGKFGKQTNWAPLADDPLYESWGERETIVLNHTWYLSDLINLETTLYQTDSSFKRELYTWDASIETTGFDIRNTSDLGEHSLTYGVERKVDKVHAQSYEDFGGIYDEEGTVTGLYVQDHWQFNDDFLVSFGIRHDSYELDHVGQSANWIKVDGNWIVEIDTSGEPVTINETFSTKKQDGFSSNFGVVYSLTDNLKLSASYAEALRGRQVADAFTVGELTHNNNLEPENVANQELGLEYNDGTFIFEASAYISEISDVVFDKFKGSEGVFYENIGDLESTGFELVVGYQANNFDVIVSYNSNNVELNNAPFVWPDANDASGFSTVILDGVDLAAYEYGGLGNAVGDSLNVNVNYEMTDELEMGFNINYVASLNNIEVFHRSIELGWLTELETIDKPSYTVVDAYVKYSPIENLTFDLAVQNLLDESYRSHGSVADYGHIEGYESIVGIKEAGRDIRLTASYLF
ncbi:TonB-dependent receptor [Colwellia sp. 1_MG-2023]|uniref:TonB-dependent receptor n=1 Tax=unclassified Colwellia TaxID=196834 RepID=UPI001C09585B|nr:MULTISPECIES: TonB-dependent receptor [unclassified Colwellia]MBU2923574.1 TonB-dependent receptor [Colwellia sp. C2M11]MDO6653251.1 TonB-dependent receptor [Colwellia sp. 3_MG-2023]MDO6664504.1 TonB-dependent receptor [Colwellia sp. 2_MG-2023]MDO6688855.1 TonB-dependent receptor [Colwellia sp. 1_MG-2023]